MSADNQPERPDNLENKVRNTPTLDEWLAPLVGGIKYIIRTFLSHNDKEANRLLGTYIPMLTSVHLLEALPLVFAYKQIYQ